MPVPNKAPSPGSNPMKRIVVYGRPSSGKTCFLAALAMARLPHPKGFSCIWVCDSQTIPKPDGKREDWNPHDPRVARYLGKEWLQKAIDAINAGDVPRANPNDVTPYRLLFDLAMLDGRIVRVEMIDYSGELVDPNLAEDILAKQLLTHLEEADGVLVLAEAPKATKDEDEAEAQVAGQHRELQVLQQALMLVAEKRRKGRAEPIPMGMLLNKWDRYSTMARYDDTAATIEKESFMQRKPPVPQQVLFNVLTAVAGSADNEPYSASFAVSAFGKTRMAIRQTPDGRARQVEVPAKLTPLQSYGLEDPLIWVCDKADHLEMRQLAADVAGLRTWKVWHATSRRALKVRSDVLTVRKRIPAHLPQAQTLNRMAGQSLLAFAKQSAFALVFFLVLAFGLVQGAMYGYDDWQLTRLHPALEAAENNASPVDYADKWKDAETFLASYSKPAWFRMASHFHLLSPEAARQKLADLQPKFAEAARIMAVRQELDIRVSGLVTQAAATQDLAQAKKMRDELARINPPDEYPDAGPKKADGLAKIDQRCAALDVAKAGADLGASYNDFMRSKELAKAAELLKSKEDRSKDVVATLRDDFRSRWEGLLTGDAKERSEKEQWAIATRAVEDVKNSSEAVKLIGPPGVIQCNALLTRIDKHHVETVYRKWYNAPSNEQFYADVINSGATADREKALAWKKLDNFKKEEILWEVSIEEIIQPDHGGFNSASTRVMCEPDGNNCMCYADWNFTKKPETARPSASSATGGKYARYDERLTLKLSYKTLDFDTPGYGDGEWTGSMHELLGGGSTTINTNRYGSPTVSLRAKLKSGSIPPEPALRSPSGGSF